MGAYPKPYEEGWEDKYRAAFARDEVYSLFLSKIQAWVKEGETIESEDTQPVKTIV